jgi:hypothetical protein
LWVRFGVPCLPLLSFLLLPLRPSTPPPHSSLLDSIPILKEDPKEFQAYNIKHRRKIKGKVMRTKSAVTCIAALFVYQQRDCLAREYVDAVSVHWLKKFNSEIANLIVWVWLLYRVG